MDAMGLPMAFGKKSKAPQNNLKAKVDTTRRDDIKPAPFLPPPRATDQDAIQLSLKKADEARASAVPSATTAKAVEEDDEDDDEIGPRPPGSSAGGKRKAEEDVDHDDDDDEDEEDEEDEESERLPISHEIVLKDHTKVCSAVAVDPSGARLASGSHDFDTKLWDFGGMDHRLKPFKSFEANGNNIVHDLDYSADGQWLLIISGTMQAKVYSREGEDGKEFVRGDVYLKDMKHTKGHIAEINAGAWHPHDKDLFLTCSNDSTLRIWDVNDKYKQKHVIVVRSKERGSKTRVTACGWSPDGKYFAGACLDGTLHVWKTESNYARPDRSCETAHPKGVDVTGLSFSRDGKTIATRASDGTVKLFDARSPRRPLAVAEGLENRYPETNVVFSPDGKTILTGLPPANKGAKGAIVFLDSETLAEQRRIAVGEGTVVRVLWHTRINQIIATLSTGAIHVLYSPRSSIHGALLPLAKTRRSTPRDVSFTSADIKPVIFTPDALPMYQDVKYGQSLHQREKQSKKMKPMEPVSGAGKGGRLGASATASMVQAIFGDRNKREDPREALLKYADKEKED